AVVPAEPDLAQRTFPCTAERLGRLRAAMRVDAGLHTCVETLLIQPHADLLPARARGLLLLARRQRAVGIVERGNDIESIDERNRRREQRAPPRRRSLRALAAVDRRLDRPVLEARCIEPARQVVDRG